MPLPLDTLLPQTAPHYISTDEACTCLGVAVLYRTGMVLLHGLTGNLLTRLLFAGAALVFWWLGWVGGADAKVFMALALFDPHLALAALAGLALLSALWPLVGQGHSVPGVTGFALGVFVLEIASL